MKDAVLVCLVLVALLGSACPPEAGPRITVSEDSLEISVMEVEGGILIENVGRVDGMVFASSLRVGQRFGLGAGKGAMGRSGGQGDPRFVASRCAQA